MTSPVNSRLIFVFLSIFFHSACQANTPSYINFESGHVRPMALSQNELIFAAVNTRDNRVEVYKVIQNGMLEHKFSVPVGVEPVALAFKNDNELWVVNHLSDSISVVDLTEEKAYIKNTLLVGDEPRDIVFAGTDVLKAFITTAHRGQHRLSESIQSVDGTGDPQLHNASVGRSDVWVFDVDELGSELGGTPLKVIELFGDTPRALVTNADKSEVYVAVFNSGNQTSIIHESVMCYGFDDTPSGPLGTSEPRAGNEPCVVGNLPFNDASSSPNGPPNKTLPSGRPLPSVNVNGENQPWTSMIVKYNQDSEIWEDTRGLNYSNGIRFNLPDHDVFKIDANNLTILDDYEHVGTTLFNMVVNPVNGYIYVSNTDSNNAQRFEGPGVLGESTVQGQIAKSRISIIDPLSGEVKTRHLNRHIDYSILKTPQSVKQHSVSTPLEMQISEDGETLYVAAIGSNKVARYQTDKLENDEFWDGLGEEFDPTLLSINHITVPQGPSGLVLNGTVLYTYSSFDQSIRLIDLSDGKLMQTTQVFNTEPREITEGRFMLYDANRSSSNGESSCASCHIFGDTDHLAWNLGNPDSSNTENFQPFPNFNLIRLSCDLLGNNHTDCLSLGITNGNGQLREFASNKGPMATQTMRGMSTHGHMHWRGDRVNGYFGADIDPNLDGDNNPDTRDMEMLDEKLSFKNFIVAFEGLLGLDIELPADVNQPEKSEEVLLLEEDMERFSSFMLSVQLPPNPIRKLDNTLSDSAQIGSNFFHGDRRADCVDFDFPSNGPEDDGVNCSGCHALNELKGFYGTDGGAATGGEIQLLKVPQLRNMYQKIGMFGLPNRIGFLPSTTDGHQNDQIRGFGFLHDGATDKLFNFLQGGVFDNGETDCEDLGLSGSHFGCDFNQGFIGITGDQTRQGLVDYMMEFESDLAPIVGQQISINSKSNEETFVRLSLLESRAETLFKSKVLGGITRECDLYVQGIFQNITMGLVYEPTVQLYKTDKLGEEPWSRAQVRNIQGSDVLTFTCSTPGSGFRLGVDRDNDGILNRDDNMLGRDKIFIDGFEAFN